MIGSKNNRDMENYLGQYIADILRDASRGVYKDIYGTMNITDTTDEISEDFVAAMENEIENFVDDYLMNRF